MGNSSSVDMAAGVELQSQGEQHLWSVFLEGRENGESEGVGVFSRTPGGGTRGDLCCRSVEVS